MKDPDAGVRARTAEALSAIGKHGDVEPVVAVLIEALQDVNSEVRAEAAEGLGRIGPPAKASIEALIKAKTDSDGGVRREAAEALENIRRSKP